MIILKSHQEIEKIRKACLVVADVLDSIGELIRPGTNTQKLDEFAEKMILSSGARPAFKGYRGYPKTVCTSLNNQVVHGIPSKDVVLNEGDIISIDVGAIVEGFYGDAARTYPVGRILPDTERLIKVTEEALSRGISQARPGSRLYDISAAVQHHVESHGYSVVREFVGHGIGRNMHEDPQIPNFGERGQGPRIKPGMVLAIEPMVNRGASGTFVLEDGWTAVTADGSLSAHFEHTVAVTSDGPWILTQKEARQ
ncbi:MAG: type I methionyl aminopeptidase [Nitrospirae bacterium GWD2_57_9]|nr:MAG: type I methionyl aminopeptidase [Nitrospirae bacterium GWD2_57_9]OGW47450.1 MAG: type I methionyl aminopeptidase [Nitrospirae bacterium GWC2_57_9]